MGRCCLTQGEQLYTLWWPRGEGQGGCEGGSRGRGYGDICIHIADSLCSTAETQHIVKQLYSIKILKKIIYLRDKYFLFHITQY